MLKLLTLAVSLTLVACLGCATTKGLDPNYVAYLDAMKNQPKIFEMKAKSGEVIELRGVESLVVYGGGYSKHIEQRKTEPSFATTLLRETFGTARSVLPGFFGWHYGYRILDKAFNSAGDTVRDSYNVSDAYNTTIPTTTTTTTTNTTTNSDSFNGDYRDIGQDANIDNSDNSINSSYNPIDNSSTTME